MAGSADSVGRLIATTALRDGERQLLRDTGGGDRRGAAKPAVAPLSSPLKEGSASNAKAVASVLLTLLDEQIEAAGQVPPRQAAASTIDTASPAGPDRPPSRYADDGFANTTDFAPGAVADARASSALPMQPAIGRAELLAQMYRLGFAAPPAEADEGVQAVPRNASGFWSADGHSARAPRIGALAVLLGMALLVAIIV